MFELLVKGLNEAGGSVRAYEACGRAARARMADEPGNAAALFLISYAAQRFVESYDDQPLTVEVAAKELSQFSALVGLLDNAFSGNSAEKKLEALNAVAAKIAISQKA